MEDKTNIEIIVQRYGDNLLLKQENGVENEVFWNLYNLLVQMQDDAYKASKEDALYPYRVQGFNNGDYIFDVPKTKVIKTILSSCYKFLKYLTNHQNPLYEFHYVELDGVEQVLRIEIKMSKDAPIKAEPVV